MLCRTPTPLSGEATYIADESKSFPAAGVSLLFQQSGDKNRAVVVPCSLSLTSYRLVVSPLNCSSETVVTGGESAAARLANPPPMIEIPILGIESWRIAVDTSSALVESFARADHALRKHLALFAQLQNHTAHSGTTVTPDAASPSPASPTGNTEPKTQSRSFFVMTIQTKHVWSIRLLFPCSMHSQSILTSFKNLMVNETVGQQGRLEALPAFAFHAQGAAREIALANDQETLGTSSAVSLMDTVEFGWNLYDPVVESTRQLRAVATHSTGARLPLRDLTSRFHWLTLEPTSRATPYTSIASYSRRLLEPVAVDLALVQDAIKARNSERVPAITFVHLGTGAVLARASQPLSRSSVLSKDAQICRAFVKNAVCADAATTTSTCDADVAPQPGMAPGALSQDADRGTGAALNALATRTQGNGPSSTSTGSGAVAFPDRPKPSARPVQSLFDDESPTPLIGTQPSRAAIAPGAAGNAVVSPSSATTTTTTTTTAPGTTASAAALAANLRSAQLLVVDCRPYAAAEINAQRGGGYERGSTYNFCQTTFWGIDNVFGVAQSFQKLRALLENFDGDQPDDGFHRALQDTLWLTNIQRVLTASAQIVETLDSRSGHSCLVHCTDGWDRTSQCTAAAQLLLDPFYRTTVGFCILMEKEFASFGHKFAERSAHQRRGHTVVPSSPGVSASETEKTRQLQVSPIWVQFMDVVYQIVQQFPDDFEFTASLLEYLSLVIYSALYGTFLCNCEQEREVEGVRLRTASVWTDVVRRVQAEKKGALPLCFLNATYDAERAWSCIRQRPAPPSSPRHGRPQHQDVAVPPRAPHMARSDGLDPLTLNCNAKHVTIWSRFYFRYDSEGFMRPRRQRSSPVPGHAAHASAAEIGLWACTPDTTSHVSHTAPAARITGTEAWRVAFEAYLQSFIDHACDARLEELGRLQALEVVRPQSYAPGAQESAWGVFDADVCFECYKPSTSWVGLKKRSTCEYCGQSYCSQCYAEHTCCYQHQMNSTKK